MDATPPDPAARWQSDLEAVYGAPEDPPPADRHAVMELLVETRRTLPESEYVSSAQAAVMRRTVAV